MSPMVRSNGHKVSVGLAVLLVLVIASLPVNYCLLPNTVREPTPEDPPQQRQHQETGMVITTQRREETNHPPRNDTCIFVLATPGSGSSTMVEVLSQCMLQEDGATGDGCLMSGENRGAFQLLAQFRAAIKRVSIQKGRNEHEKAAWKRAFTKDLTDVNDAERKLVSTILNPKGSATCWGFKEIRYGRSDPTQQSLVQDVNYLTTLCANPKIIVHTRKNAEDEWNSTVLRGKPNQGNVTVRQRQCLDTFAGIVTTTEGEGGGNGSPLPSSSSPCINKDDLPVFRHYLDDYISKNANFLALWKFLGCTAPIPKTMVKKSH